MVNRYRGEVVLVLNGQTHVMRLTLGLWPNWKRPWAATVCWRWSSALRLGNFARAMCLPCLLPGCGAVGGAVPLTSWHRVKFRGGRRRQRRRRRRSWLALLRPWMVGPRPWIGRV